ncbi:MAG TPA: hypothetical protein VGL26_11900 [Jatrophihabitans sp.]
MSAIDVRRHWGFAVAASAVAAMLIAGLISVQGATSAAPLSPDGLRTVAARAHLVQLLRSAPRLPGAQPAAATGESALSHPAVWYGDPDTLDAPTWFTAPGSIKDGVTYLAAHAPPEVTNESSGSGSDYADIIFAATPTEVITGVQIAYTIVPSGKGVAVRVDASGVLLHVRDPATYVQDATSVDVDVIRTGAPAVNLRPTGAAVSTLADTVNRMTPGLSTATGDCARMQGEHSDVLTFHSPQHTYVLMAPLGCTDDRTTLAIDGGAPLELRQSAELDTAVLTVLGLPMNYGL